MRRGRRWGESGRWGLPKKFFELGNTGFPLAVVGTTPRTYLSCARELDMSCNELFMLAASCQDDRPWYRNKPRSWFDKLHPLSPEGNASLNTRHEWR